MLGGWRVRLRNGSWIELRSATRKELFRFDLEVLYGFRGGATARLAGRGNFFPEFIFGVLHGFYWMSSWWR
ncbi:hypothetical protein D3C71_2070310 [compost metagenome]